MNPSNINLSILEPIFNFELFKVNAQDKEDVKQTAILRILSSMKNYDANQLPEDKLFSFAQVIVKRTVVDYYRKSSRKIEQNSTSVNWCDNVDEETGSGGADAFNTTVEDYSYEVAGIRLDFLNNADKFTPQERKIIEFMLFDKQGEGMELAEVYTTLGIHKSHGARALKKLRDVCADRD